MQRLTVFAYIFSIELRSNIGGEKQNYMTCNHYTVLTKFLQAQITLKVISGLYPGVTTVELDNLAAETAATMTTKHPDYAILAARIAVSNLHKETKKVFSGKIDHPGLAIFMGTPTFFCFLMYIKVETKMCLAHLSRNGVFQLVWLC